ncbi:MAG: hypothetical protein KG003_11515 [Bacteroidetes bacterium]|nr:hypothetical protein [Bacteroidota bacterium]
MKTNLNENQANRRGFLKILAGTAATLGITSYVKSAQQAVEANMPDAKMHIADQWMKTSIKGKHRMVFDVTQPHDVLPFAWPKVFLMTNGATGTPEKENTAMVVLRHNAICYAFGHELWAKYNFGQMFKAMSPPEHKEFATKNPFWQPAKGAFNIPGIGAVPIGINELQESGVLFCVCDAAMTVFSAVAADMMKMDAATVKKEWEAAVLPGIQIVPSGVWAVGRAQEYDCSYCFAG